MIRVGVAGWDYADWNGIVYPAVRPTRFDRLEYVSRFIDVVEINTTFYRPVAARTAESWVRRTRHHERFRFCAKVHRSWTHDRDRQIEANVRATTEGLRPLRDSGRLLALLVQFPQSFHSTPENRDYLERLLDQAGGWPVVVEVRHASWEPEEIGSWFAQLDVGWCIVDQPLVGGQTARPVARVTGRVGYLRLHGRNTANWFRVDAGRDARYDYLYGAAELDALADEVRRLATVAEEFVVVQNNHFKGQALVNALQMKSLLEAERPPAPEELVWFYPDLEPSVSVIRRTLF